MADAPLQQLTSHGLLHSITAQELQWDEIKAPYWQEVKDQPLKALIQLTGTPRHLTASTAPESSIPGRTRNKSCTALTLDTSFEAAVHAIGDKPLGQLGIEDLTAVTSGLVHNCRDETQAHTTDYINLITLAWDHQAEAALHARPHKTTDHQSLEALSQGIASVIFEKTAAPHSERLNSQINALQLLDETLQAFFISTHDQHKQEQELQSWMHKYLGSAKIKQIPSPADTAVYEVHIRLNTPVLKSMAERFKDHGLKSYDFIPGLTTIRATKDSPLDVVLGQRAAEQTRSR